MKQIFFIPIVILGITACTARQADPTAAADEKPSSSNISTRDTVILPGREMTWQESFGLTHDPDKDSIWFRPVSYYINDKDCSSLAIDFYYGRLRPGDDPTTDSLLLLATTNNNKLRPFYRWCLNKTLLIQDGALAEHTGEPARKYAEKFPKEFFDYMDIDPSGDKYLEWVNAILYSGFYLTDDYKKPKEIQARMITTMKANCNDCDSKTLSRIEQFAKDCFN